jgi:imidazolonepropionase-like amidohydrolase
MKKKPFLSLMIFISVLFLICIAIYRFDKSSDVKERMAVSNSVIGSFAPGKLLLRNVTIVNTVDGTLKGPVDLLIYKGKITEIAPQDQIKADSGTKVIDASGKYVVPGYLNMHMHVIGEGNPAAKLALMLANGITGFRQMGGSPELLLQRKNNTLGIAGNQPELLIMPGTILTPVNTSTIKDAEKNVRKQKAQGADFIKIGLLTPDVFFATLSNAKKMHIPALGHLPSDVDILAASDAGMRSVEHLGLDYGALTACSSQKSALIAAAPTIPAMLKLLPAFMDNLSMKLLTNTLINPAAGISKEEYLRINRIISSFDKKIAAHSADIFVANGTWQVPTLIRLRTSQLAFLPEMQTNPNLKYVSKDTKAKWNKVTIKYEKELTPLIKRELIKAYELELRLVKIYDDQGVKMMTGTDGEGGGWLVTGFSLQQEFDELEKAGISPFHVLQMATINGAQFLGRTETMGTVEVGKNADLVLLDSNPTKSVQNLHRINTVIRAGYYYNKTDIEKLKQQVLNRINNLNK